MKKKNPPETSMSHNVKICKGCKKILPEGYKGKYCEACKNKHADAAKKVGKVAVKVIGIVATVTPLGKFIPKKK